MVTSNCLAVTHFPCTSIFVIHFPSLLTVKLSEGLKNLSIGRINNNIRLMQIMSDVLLRSASQEYHANNTAK